LFNRVLVSSVIGVLRICFGKIACAVLIYINRGTGTTVRGIRSVAQSAPDPSSVSRADLVNVDAGVSFQVNVHKVVGCPKRKTN
jgi:hypothetical protein